MRRPSPPETIQYVVLLWLAAGACTAANITEITLPGTRIFPESIPSTADGSLIVGSLGNGHPANCVQPDRSDGVAQARHRRAQQGTS
jgi:hypothetical protein